jgi:hypothetical protein
MIGGHRFPMGSERVMLLAVFSRCGAVAILLAALAVFSMDASTFAAGHYAPGVTQGNPSCGQCHAGNSAAVSVSMNVPPARSLALGQAISITTAVSGGATVGGGFAADATAGQFTAGNGSVIAGNGLAITHDRTGSAAKSWTYGYAAPAAPGLIELHAVALSTDGDGTAAGDHHAFSGYADNVVPAVPTPVRLYANDSGVKAIGESCIGGFDNYPVLGGKEAPAVGNQAFKLELHGGATRSYAALILGTTLRPTPLDLRPWGIDGCKLFVDELICRFVCTYGTNPRIADGSAIFELPIPTDAALRGQKFVAQGAILDMNVARAIRMTLANAVEVTVR